MEKEQTSNLFSGFVNLFRSEYTPDIVTVDEARFLEIPTKPGDVLKAVQWIEEHYKGQAMIWTLLPNSGETPMHVQGDCTVRDISVYLDRPPVLDDILSFCSSTRSWVEGEAGNICFLLYTFDVKVVRWATLLSCSYLLFFRRAMSSLAAVTLLYKQRTLYHRRDKKRTPDMSRQLMTYLLYIERVTKQQLPQPLQPITVREIVMRGIPRCNVAPGQMPGCIPMLAIRSTRTGDMIYLSTPDRHYSPEDGVVRWHVPNKVCFGDILLTVHHCPSVDLAASFAETRATGEPLVEFALHSALLDMHDSAPKQSSTTDFHLELVIAQQTAQEEAAPFANAVLALQQSAQQLPGLHAQTEASNAVGARGVLKADEGSDPSLIQLSDGRWARPVQGFCMVLSLLVVLEPLESDVNANGTGNWKKCRIRIPIEKITSIEVGGGRLVMEWDTGGARGKESVVIDDVGLAKHVDDIGALIKNNLLNNVQAVRAMRTAGGHEPDTPKSSDADEEEEEEEPLELSHESKAIDLNTARRLRSEFPYRFRSYTKWDLLFSTELHGSSVGTFFNRTGWRSPTLLVVMDETRAVFGAFCSAPWEMHYSYFGTGECFVWKVDGDRLGVYRWGMQNDMFQLAHKKDGIAVGGGKCHAIWFDAAFENGTSGPCETFNSPALAGTGNEKPWRVLHMEAWGLSF